MTFRPCSGLPRRGRILKTWVSLILNPDWLSWCRLYIYTGAPSLWDVVLIVNARVSFIHEVLFLSPIFYIPIMLWIEVFRPANLWFSWSSITCAKLSTVWSSWLISIEVRGNLQLESFTVTKWGGITTQLYVNMLSSVLVPLEALSFCCLAALAPGLISLHGEFKWPIKC